MNLLRICKEGRSIIHRISSFSNMPKSAIIVLADGAEEMESVITADVLRRGGVNVTIAGLAGSQPVKCSRNVTVLPDLSLDDALANAPYDAVILPGGLQGADSLAQSNKVKSLLQDQEKSGRVVAAICAAPIALKSHGIGLGKKLTSHPSMKDRLEEGGQYKYSEDRVVVDGQLITSRGPGTTFEFALTLVEELMGKEKIQGLVQQMLLKL